MAGFTVPNKAITFPFQSRVYEADWIISTRASGGQYGVLRDDCEVTGSTIPDMSVDVAAGLVVIDGAQITVAGGTVPLADADPLLPRKDTIVAVDDGTTVALTGTPDAAPLPPNPDDTQVGLAVVDVPALVTSVTDLNIVDKRVWVQSPLSASDWQMLSGATDIPRSSNATLSLDPVMAFPVSNGGKYRVRGQVKIRQSVSSNNGGLKWGFSGPASPVVYGGFYFTGTANLAVAGSSRIMPASYNSTIQGLTGISTTGTDLDWDIRFDLFFRNGSTPGTFGFTWAQNTAVASPTITRLAESFMEYQVV